MKNKKILMLLENTFPPDIRVEKEAKALLDKGFDVSLVCKKGENSINEWNGMKIYNVYVKNNIFSKLKNQIFVIYFDFLIFLDKLFQKEYFDIIHVHDLRLVPTALKIKEKYNCKVIVDFHENYPAAVREWNKSARGIKKIVLDIFNNYNKWFKIERRVCKEVDKIIVVVDEMKERIMMQHNVEEDKIVIVSNLESLSFVKEAKIDKKLMEEYKNKFVVLYIGGFGYHRGLDIAIKGMKYINKEDIILLLVGKGNGNFEKYLYNLIKFDQLENKVKIIPWQPFDKVFTYQKLASVCIIPHNSNEHTNNTIPHKLYQYMMVGKPLIVSSCFPLARIVKRANCGLIFNAGDEKDFANKVLELYENKELRKKFSKNSLKFIFDQNNICENESKKLINLYEKI
jgi:glycosyltransferase involved in cell wall biosynthesis